MKIYIVAFTLICSCMVLVMAGYQGTIPDQSSYCLSNNGSCSSASVLCQCASVVTGERVCTHQMNCEYAQSCDTTNSCEKDGNVCLLDPRCDYQPLCYSVAIFSTDACPPDN